MVAHVVFGTRRSGASSHDAFEQRLCTVASANVVLELVNATKRAMTDSLAADNWAMEPA